MWEKSSKVNRRNFLKLAVTAIVAGTVAGVGGYWGGVAAAPSPKIVTKKVTTTLAAETVTRTVTPSPVTVTKTVTMTPAPPPIIPEIKVAIGIDADTFDAHGMTTTLIANINNYIYESLLWVDGEGKILPNLATDWEISSDGLKYKFKLRKNVKFHDGVPFNAKAVKSNIERLINPDTRVPLRGWIGPISGAGVVDDYTVEIVLKRPFAPFLASLTSFPAMMISPRVIEKYGSEPIKEYIGTGPFKFGEWIRGDRMVLLSNEAYWGDKPTVKKLVFLVMPEAGTREAALLAGDVDVAYIPPPSGLPKLKKDPRVKVYTPLSTRIMYMPLLPRGPLADPKVRQALNYAVDKEAIIEKALFGLGTMADAPVPPTFFGHAKMPVYSYDPDKAKKLLVEAGYPEGFKIKFMHPVGRYIQDKQVAEAVQAQLMDIGLDVELMALDWPSYVGQLIKPFEERVFDTCFLGWGPAVLDAHFTLWSQFHTGERVNTANYSNPRVDKLLEDAAKEVDPSKRLTYYKEAQEIIWRDAPWIFLYVQKVYIATKPELRNIWFHPNGEMFYLTYVK